MSPGDSFRIRHNSRPSVPSPAEAYNRAGKEVLDPTVDIQALTGAVLRTGDEIKLIRCFKIIVVDFLVYHGLPVKQAIDG